MKKMSVMVIDDYLLINCHLIIWMQYILIKNIYMCRSINKNGK